MRLPVAALAALGSLPTALARMQFLSPPAFTGLAEHPVHVVGSSLDIQWTASQKGKKLSVVLYQLNATQAASFSGQFHSTDGPFEFITHDQVGATSFTWIVGTTKDLSASPLFSIAVWEEGTQDTDSATDVFVITKAGAETTSSSTASSSAASSSSSFSTSTTSTATSSTATSWVSGTSITPVSSGTTDPATASTPPATEQPAATAASLSTGAAVGIGIGATLAVVLFLAGGWYFGRRRALRRQQDMNADMDKGAVGQGTTPVEYVQPDKDHYTERVEAPAGNYRSYELS